ncbi:MAG: GNAT family N-acetyltransferase [Minisyncoccia bacterium]
MCINQTPEYISRKYKFFVAEDGDEIVGIAGMRTAPEHMKVYSSTSNPAELYIIASKYKSKGIGNELILKIQNEAKSIYTELVLYSANSHSDSWGFYDNLNFERVGDALAPNGESGMIWRKIL